MDLAGCTAYRLFNGTTEGLEGLTIDRYGEQCLVQTFRDIEVPELDLPWPIVVRRRGEPKPPERSEAVAFIELGIRYAAPLVHPGQDPWLFLDFRAGRRWLKANAAGKSVLNTFAYTCGAGVAAMVGGAASVLNLDHGKWCLEAGRDFAALNEVQMGYLREDFFAAVRQFAGLKLKGRGARRRGYTKRPAQRFDLIVLDPPTFAKSPMGAVDIVRDYGSLAKPCFLALKEGGALLATNHAAGVSRVDWIEATKRCAAKAGRPVREVEIIEPEADFPPPAAGASLRVRGEQEPLLKMAVFHL